MKRSPDYWLAWMLGFSVGVVAMTLVMILVLVRGL